MNQLLLQIIIPCALAAVFLLVQVCTKASEKALTALLVLFTVLTFILYRQQGEILLFFIGLALGLIVEVGLGLISRSQHWDKASLWGVPYWLPLIWAIGFILIHRVGDLLVK